MSVRILMSWYPKLPVKQFPYAVAYAPTGPFLSITRKVIPPLAGVDVTPVVWFGLVSFLSKIFVGPQGLLVLLLDSSTLEKPVLIDLQVLNSMSLQVFTKCLENNRTLGSQAGSLVKNSYITDASKKQDDVEAMAAQGSAPNIRKIRFTF
ncbi:YGGT family [Musa troglodytarum]|uniref:YGGT family n=1 Tax=Musa troglodytarum TaxID=320322 RepID=A0A9E7GMW6_9LILI|nr:YGGT family [Musa troglodytarum]URE17770.1 YGGT family [Musa troglodytarum]